MPTLYARIQAGTLADLLRSLTDDEPEPVTVREPSPALPETVRCAA